MLRFLIMLVLTVNLCRAEEPSIVAPNAIVTKLADGFKFTEGCASDAQGNVYFTDQPNDKILVWTTAGKLETVLDKSGRSNGLCVDHQGILWACADEQNQLWTIDLKTKKPTVVVKDFDGKLLNGPNDIWVSPTGVAYFTNPYYRRPYWKRELAEQTRRGVFMLKDGKLEEVDADFGQSNGIIGSQDGKLLYVADINKRKTYRYEIDTNGKPGKRTLFCEMGSDGMTIDDQGNIYLTSGKVHVYNRDGKLVQSIDVPESPANVCFGGKDRDVLFITARTGFYSVKTKVRGSGSQ
jgi:gluconolactonase